MAETETGAWFVITADLKEFGDMWKGMFLCVLFSSILVYGLAALISFCTLHKHKHGRWYCFFVAIVGLLFPVVGGSISSAVIAGVYDTLAWTMSAKVALIWGAGQTVVAIILSFTRLLATL